MAQNKQQHHAKATHKKRKERKEFRNFREDAVHGRCYGPEHSVSHYMNNAREKLSFRKRTHRGKDYFMSKVKLNNMIRLEDYLAARREINADKAFLHTQARTAQRWLAAEPIYPLR